MRAFLHDLASPLTAIGMSAHALRSSKALAAGSLAHVARIEEAVGAAFRIVASLQQAPPKRRPRAAAPPDSEERVDLYVLCCDLAKVRRAADGSAIHCRAFGDGRGGWDRERVTRLLAELLDYSTTHLENGGPMTVAVTGMARYVRVDLQGLGWLSPRKRQMGLQRLSRIAGALEGAMVAATVSSGGSVFTLRLPR